MLRTFWEQMTPKQRKRFKNFKEFVDYQLSAQKLDEWKRKFKVRR